MLVTLRSTMRPVQAAVGLAAQAGAAWLGEMAGAAPASRGWSWWRIVAASSVVCLGLGLRGGVGGRGGPPGGAGVG